MIEIEEPPDIQACSTYMVPLTWLWSHRAAKWKSYELVDADTDTIRRHRCERHSTLDPPWRQLTFNDVPDPELVESSHAGARRVRQALKDATKESTP